MKHKEAFTICEKSDGYAALLCRASQRLFFGGYLVPDFEGISRSVQPDPVRQVEEDLESLLASAQHAQELLKERIAPGARWAVGTARPHPQGVPVAMFAIDPGVKTAKAARTKALAQFAPSEGSQRYRHLVDLARVGLVFSNCDMLQAGLEHILRCFPEVVFVSNRFSTPSRLGGRWVEMLVVLQLVTEDGEKVPHVCELRLEELSMHRARIQAEEDMDRFFRAIRRTYDRASRELDAVVYMAHSIISKPIGNQNLRTFRCNLARQFGSTICGWRRILAGGGRQLNFQRFRDACHTFKCRRSVTELWQDLDPGLSGTISLFEVDPDAVSLLIRLRARIVALLNDSLQHDSDADALFARLTFHIRPARPGQLDAHEFRSVLKPLGFSAEDADRAFSYLDYHGGSNHAPPATVNKLDLLWLKRLSQLVDVNAITLSSVSKPSEEDYFRHVIESCQSARRAKRVLRRSASTASVSAGCTSGDETDTSEQLPQEPISRRVSFKDACKNPAATEAEEQNAAIQIQRTYRSSLLHAISNRNENKHEDELSTDCPAEIANDTGTVCCESDEPHELPKSGDVTLSSDEQQAALPENTLQSSNVEQQTVTPDTKDFHSNGESEKPHIPDSQVDEPKWQEVFDDGDTF